MSVLNFLQYNNAVPIALGVMFLGASGVFAATNPQALYSTTQQVVSVDNTYISSKDLSSYTPTVQILSVNEDSENYYVSYRLTTINVVDAVWRDVIEDRKMTVARGVLGQYGDLGLYVTEQLNQIVDSQLSYLREVQEIERREVTQKVVATAYAGLIGAMLDTTTETIPGYEPVVTPPPPRPEASPRSTDVPPGESQNPSPPIQLGGGTPPPPAAPQVNGPGAPVLQLLGPNPHVVDVGAIYQDLGVVVTDDSGVVPPVQKYVDGILAAGPVVIDTSSPREFHIRYEAVDAQGNIGAIGRAVLVSGQSATVEPNPEPTSTTTPAAQENQEDTAISAPPETPQEPSSPGAIPASEPEAAPASVPEAIPDTEQ